MAEKTFTDNETRRIFELAAEREIPKIIEETNTYESLLSTAEETGYDTKVIEEIVQSGEYKKEEIKIPEETQLERITAGTILKENAIGFVDGLVTSFCVVSGARYLGSVTTGDRPIGLLFPATLITLSNDGVDYFFRKKSGSRVLRDDPGTFAGAAVGAFLSYVAFPFQ